MHKEGREMRECWEVEDQLYFCEPLNLQIPFEALKSVTRKATASLNSLGTKLIGL